MIGDLVKRLIAAGCEAAEAAATIAEAFAAGAKSADVRGQSADETAQRRREYDRNRKREERSRPRTSGGNPRTSAESADAPLYIYKNKKDKKVSKSPVQQLSADWAPPERAFEIAKDLGLSVREIEPRFRDYLASSGKRYADYDAAFCNFIRNTPKFNGGPNGHARPNNLAQRAFDLADQIREREFAAGIGRPDDALGSGGDRGEVDILLPERRQPGG